MFLYRSPTNCNSIPISPKKQSPVISPSRNSQTVKKYNSTTLKELIIRSTSCHNHEKFRLRRRCFPLHFTNYLNALSFRIYRDETRQDSNRSGAVPGQHADAVPPAVQEKPDNGKKRIRK